MEPKEVLAQEHPPTAPQGLQGPGARGAGTAGQNENTGSLFKCSGLHCELWPSRSTCGHGTASDGASSPSPVHRQLCPAPCTSRPGFNPFTLITSVHLLLFFLNFSFFVYNLPIFAPLGLPNPLLPSPAASVPPVPKPSHPAQPSAGFCY